jgi:hypothetical protein
LNPHSDIEAIARAVLYEGYLLYPYRTSSLKNSKPAMMGTLYPGGLDLVRSGAERAELSMECLLAAEGVPTISAELRFLQLTSPETVESIERKLPIEPGIGHFSIDDDFQLAGESEMRVEPLASNMFKLSIRVRNTTSIAAVEPHPAHYAFHSAHVVATLEGGHFISLTDPPKHLHELASRCVNAGIWPVLVGDAGTATTILASAIVLPDYPQIASESPGDLHDSSEIDEILTLRILTMTDEEKMSARDSGTRAQSILHRTESLTREHMANLHGAFREDVGNRWSAWDIGLGTSVNVVRIQGTDLSVGDRVTLSPRKHADILDSALKGRTATIVGIEQDLEDRIHVALVVDDDPGRDLGELRQPGHRFFFSPDELEPLRVKTNEAAP